MNTDALEREELRRIKGGIMRALGRKYGGETCAVTRGTFDSMFRRPRHDLIDQALAYLVEQGYLRRNEDRIDARDTEPVISYECTAKGSNLVNGEASDPGIQW